LAIVTGGVARPSLDHRLQSFDACGIPAAAPIGRGARVNAGL
jgi:hypothetical protein